MATPEPGTYKNTYRRVAAGKAPGESDREHAEHPGYCEKCHYGDKEVNESGSQARDDDCQEEEKAEDDHESLTRRSLAPPACLTRTTVHGVVFRLVAHRRPPG